MISLPAVGRRNSVRRMIAQSASAASSQVAEDRGKASSMCLIVDHCELESPVNREWSAASGADGAEAGAGSAASRDCRHRQAPDKAEAPTQPERGLSGTAARQRTIGSLDGNVEGEDVLHGAGARLCRSLGPGAPRHRPRTSMGTLFGSWPLRQPARTVRGDRHELVSAASSSVQGVTERPTSAAVRKESKRGTATPDRDVELIARRFKLGVEISRASRRSVKRVNAGATAGLHATLPTVRLSPVTNVRFTAAANKAEVCRRWRQRVRGSPPSAD